MTDKGQFERMASALRRERGLLGASAMLLRNIRRAILFRSQEREDAFDARYGTETSRWVFRRQLGVGKGQLDDVFEYAPTPVRTFNQMVRALPIAPRDYCFVDYGSGKGRALILAAEAGFRRAVGVEISDRMHAVASKNVEVYRKSRPRSDIRLDCADARDFEPPGEDAVYYFCQPFPDWVMSAVLQRLVASVDRSGCRALLLFVTPFGAKAIERTGNFGRIAESGPDDLFTWYAFERSRQD
jgi:SAM-dependent methyltransferase